MARILIVEDEMLTALHLSEMVEDLGHEVVGAAPDRAEALRLAQAGADIALVDLNLRDGPSGPDVAEDLITHFGVGVLFVTANPGMAPPIPGALGVMNKPIEEDDVGSALDYALHRKRGEAFAPPASLYVFS